MSAAMLAKLSVDLRLAIDAEGRVPEVVLMVFAEPTKQGEVAVRVNEYRRDARTERVIDAVASATRPEQATAGVGMVDPYHPWRPNVPSDAARNDPRVTGPEHE
ncbi:MAG: hypothetical protein ACOYB2_11005 [Limnohabitans sp.]